MGPAALFLRHLRSALGRLFDAREESLAFQSIILTAARAVSFALTFAIPIVLVRIFSQAEFGIYKQLFLLSGTAVPILNLGLYASLFYFVPRDADDGHRYIVQALGLLTITGGLAAVAIIVLKTPVAHLFGGQDLERFLPWIALLVMIATPSEMVGAVQVVDRRPLLAASTMAFGDLARALALVGAAVMFGTLTAVLVAAVATAAVRGAWLATYVRLRRSPTARSPSWFDLVEQLKYSLPFAAAVVFQIGLQRFHEYWVAARVPPGAFAVYAVGILQIPVLGMLVQSVVEVMLIRAAEAFKAAKQAEMRRLWNTALQRLAVVLIPAWCLTELFAGDLIGFLFGTAYAGATPVFRVFAGSILLLMIVDHGILRATGDTGFLLKANAIGLAAGGVVVVIVSQWSVMIGGVLGFLVGLAVTRALGVFQVGRRLGVSAGAVLPWKFLARVLGAAGVSLGAALPARLLPHPGLRLIVGGALFAVVYATLVFVLELVPRTELARVLRRITGRRPGS